MAVPVLMMAETVAVVVAAVLGFPLAVLVVLETRQVLHQLKDMTALQAHRVVKAQAAEVLVKQPMHQLQVELAPVEMAEHLT